MSLLSDPPSYFRIHVFACTNERPAGHPRGSCAGRGSEDLRAYMKDQVRKLGLPDVRVNSSGCLNRCELGPVMVIYPEAVWYGYRSRADIDEIIATHLVAGGRVERLLLRPEDGPAQD